MKKPYIIVVAVILVVGAVTGYWYLNSHKGNDNQTTASMQLYYLNSIGSELASENRKVAIGNNLDETASNLMIELLKGSTQNSIKNVIPAKTTLLSLTVKDKIATVDFSGQFYGPTDADNLLSVFTIVKTLTQLEKIEKVSVLVDKKEILDTVKRPLGSSDIVLNAPTQSDSIAINLYFYDANVEYLVSEKRNIQIKDGNEPIEKYIVDELIAGPKSKDLVSVLSPDTKLISAQTKDGICYVNFGKEFISKNEGGTVKENGAIYAVVNSLTELSEVEGVQFLVEGKKLESFSHFELSEPFPRNDDVIKK